MGKKKGGGAGGGGKNSILNGRALFTYNPDLFKDNEDDSDDELLNTDFIYINANIHDNNISMCIDTACPTSLISRKDARKLNIFSLLQPYHKKIRKNVTPQSCKIHKSVKLQPILSTFFMIIMNFSGQKT